MCSSLNKLLKAAIRQESGSKPLMRPNEDRYRYLGKINVTNCFAELSMLVITKFKQHRDGKFFIDFDAPSSILSLTKTGHSLKEYHNHHLDTAQLSVEIATRHIVLSESSPKHIKPEAQHVLSVSPFSASVSSKTPCECGDACSMFLERRRGREEVGWLITSTNPGLPTPSCSTHKHHASQHRPDCRSSPFPKSQRNGANIQNMKLLDEAESSSSEVEEDVSNLAISERRWPGRRGSRRPGLTFAQQMGLIAARASGQHESSLNNAKQSEWEPIGRDYRQEKKPQQMHRTSWLSAPSTGISDIHESHNDTLEMGTCFGNIGGSAHGHIKTIDSNPFLDESDVITSEATSTTSPKKSYIPLRKSASGTLLDPVDIIAPSASASENQQRASPFSTRHSGLKPAPALLASEGTVELSTQGHVEEDGSETEKEDDGEDEDGEEEEEEEEEDDSPYLIETGEDIGLHSELQAKESWMPIADECHHAPIGSASDLGSDSSEMTDLEQDDEADEEDGAKMIGTHEKHLKGDEARSTVMHASLAAKERRPPPITRYLSASKSSGSSSLSSGIGNQVDSTIPVASATPSSSKGQNSRERRSWSKPVLGNVDENPRGQKTTFANPYYHHDPYRPPASSLLPPEHPEFSPAPVPAPRVLFPQDVIENDEDSDDEGEATPMLPTRRDLRPGVMRPSPTATSSTLPATRMLQRRISSQMPPIARQGSTLLERAQRVRVARTESRAQTTTTASIQHDRKRSMEDVLGGMDDVDNGEDELLLRHSKSTARVLFGKRSAIVPEGQAQMERQAQQQAGETTRPSSNKRIKMEHVIGK
ncbi:hypothetical protein QFC19_007974 [Naganishia cerealis]|uniref:Uncharacterized protein n=1 Tax=Naganishia cerealis TaxID=610337 RepID=A0ACC2V674_9TREE|nr:hypothetical protein QFC19_007974 [Naganishia cerealis]